MTREEKLCLIWRITPCDYRSSRNGMRSILVLRAGGTWLVPLERLTEEEIDYKLRGNGIRLR